MSLDATKKLFRWGPIDAALLPLGYSMVASFDLMYKLFGICWPESQIIFDKDKALWILENGKVADVSNEFTKKIIIPDDQRKSFYTLWNERVKALTEIQTQVDNCDLSELSQGQLGSLFAKWNRIYIDFWVVGMTAELSIMV